MHNLSKELEKARDLKEKSEKALERAHKRLGIKEAEIEVLTDTVKKV
jgi:hypothetical protein